MTIKEIRHNLIKDIQEKVKYHNNMVGYYCEQAITTKLPQNIKVAEEEVTKKQTRENMSKEIISLIWEHIPDSYNNIKVK